MALIPNEILGHVVRLSYDGVNVAFAINCSVDYGSQTKAVAHKDVAPGSLGAGIVKNLVVSRDIKATCKAYFKEGASFATLLADWKAGVPATYKKVRMQNVVSGNSYREFDGHPTSMKEEANEGDFHQFDVNFTGLGDVTSGTTT